MTNKTDDAGAHGATATKAPPVGPADPADRMNEDLARSLGRMLAEHGVDTSALKGGDLIKIVASLGDQASRAAMRMLGLDVEATSDPQASAFTPPPLQQDAFCQPRYGRSSFGPSCGLPSGFPSPDESFSLGDTPNGDFLASEQASTAALDAGVFKDMERKQRAARVDTFKTVVAGGLHFMSDLLESGAARLAGRPGADAADLNKPLAGAPFQAPHHTTPFMSLRAGAAQRPRGEWVEVDPSVFSPPVDETGFVVNETAGVPADGGAQ